MTRKNKEALAVVFRGLAVSLWFLGIGNLLGSYVVNVLTTLILVGLGFIAWDIGKHLDKPNTN